MHSLPGLGVCPLRARQSGLQGSASLDAVRRGTRTHDVRNLLVDEGRHRLAAAGPRAAVATFNQPSMYRQ